MSTNITQKLANPSPLGLLGFGMTTILLNLHNSDIITLNVVIVAMGLAMGGLAQIIAGIMEFRNHNTFGGTAFTAYGCFWWSLIFIWCDPTNGMVDMADSKSMGFYLLLWAVFTLFMFIATLKHNKITQLVFLSLTVLFVLLAITDFTEIHQIKVIAGYVGLLCGLSAVYSSGAQVINEEFGKKVLPLF